MAQEVQTNLEWYVIPNRIEGIWISERKIREHYQVTPKMSFECNASATMTPRASSSQRDFAATKWKFTLTQSWPTEFKIVNKSVRIPMAWWYLANITIWWWTSNFQITVSIKVWGETIATWTWNNSSTTIETVLNFGKFDLLEFRVSWYYQGSSDGATTTAYANINLKKL